MNNSAIRVAATKLFATRGYEAVSLQAIADVVGVAKQTLLYHYPSKEVLRRAVIDQVFEHYGAAPCRRSCSKGHVTGQRTSAFHRADRRVGALLRQRS